jgi:hypothetical protein
MSLILKTAILLAAALRLNGPSETVQKWSATYLGGDIAGALRAIVDNLNGPSPDPEGPYAWTTIERATGKLDEAYTALPVGKAKAAIAPDYSVQTLLVSQNFSQLLKALPPSAVGNVDAPTLYLLIKDLSAAGYCAEAVPYLNVLVAKSPNAFEGPMSVYEVSHNDLGWNALVQEIEPGGALANSRLAKIASNFATNRTFTGIEVIALARNWLASDPNDPAALQTEADQLADAHQHAAVLLLIEKLRHLRPWSPTGLTCALQSYKSLYALNRESQAREVAALQAIVTTHDPSRLPQTTAEAQATLALKSGEKGEARAAIEVGLKSFSRSAILQADLAELELTYGYRTQQAVSAAHLAVDADPHNANNWSLLLNADRQAKDWGAVVNAFQQMKTQPLVPLDKTYDDMRDALHNLHRDKDAATELKQHVQLYPNSFDLRNSYGTALKDSGSRDEAIEQYRASLRLRSDNAAPLGVDYNLESQGKKDQEIEFLENYTKSHPKAQSAWSFLASLAGNGDPTQQAKIWRQAQAASPGAYWAYHYEWLAYANARKNAEAVSVAKRGLQSLRAAYPEAAPILYICTMYNPPYFSPSPNPDKNWVKEVVDDAHGYIAAGGEASYAYLQLSYAYSKLGSDQSAFDAAAKAFGANPDDSSGIGLMFSLEPTTAVHSGGHFQAVARLVQRDPNSIYNLTSAALWNTKWGGSTLLGYIQAARAHELDPQHVGLQQEAEAAGDLGDAFILFRTQYQENTQGIAASDRYIGWFDAARAQVRNPSTKVQLDLATQTVRLTPPNSDTIALQVHPATGCPTMIQIGGSSIRCKYTVDGQLITQVRFSSGRSIDFVYDKAGRMVSVQEDQSGKPTRSLRLRYNQGGSLVEIAMTGVGAIRPSSDEDDPNSVKNAAGKKIREFFQETAGLSNTIKSMASGRISASEIAELFGKNIPDAEDRQTPPPARALTLTATATSDNFGEVFDLISDNAHHVTYVARGDSLQSVSQNNPKTGPISFAQTRTRVLAMDASGRLIANDGPDIVAFEPGNRHPKKLFSTLLGGSSGTQDGSEPGSLIVARDGSIWCSAGANVFRYLKGHLDTFSMFLDRTKFPAESDMISRVVETVTGTIDVIASDEGHRIFEGMALIGGRLEFDGAGFQRVQEPYQGSNYFYTGYTKTGPETAIVSTSTEFYNASADGALQEASKDPSYQALKAKLNMVWLGTHGAALPGGAYLFGCAGGVVGWSPQGWFVPQELNDSLPDRSLAAWGSHTVHAIATDASGHAYVGTDSGLTIYTGPVNPNMIAHADTPTLFSPTQAVCSRTAYSLSTADTDLTDWTSRPIGRLTGTVGWSKTPTGRSYMGPFGQQAVTLNLSRLPKHHNVQVEIELFVIGSWDGDGDFGPGPDIIDIQVPEVGTLLHSTFFNNTEGGAASAPAQSYPDPYGVGRHLGHTGAAEVNSLGFTDVWANQVHHRDAVYKLKYTFAHTAGNLQVSITGENVVVGSARFLTDDENWGIGSILVKTDN